MVLVAPDAYDNIYRAQERNDEEYQPRAIHRAPQPRLKQQAAQEGPKQPPVQTIRNYNKVKLL